MAFSQSVDSRHPLKASRMAQIEALVSMSSPVIRTIITTANDTIRIIGGSCFFIET
jgi:hypothetical protein